MTKSRTFRGVHVHHRKGTRKLNTVRERAIMGEAEFWKRQAVRFAKRAARAEQMLYLGHHP